jgi:N-acetylglucosaminyl-diphospho-decaprenol L-rhamnosyltransferase
VGGRVLTAVVVHRRRPVACVRTGRALLDQGVDRLIVVDNGSEPEQVAAVRAGLPGAEVVELGRNTGFGPAANEGFRRWLGSGEGEWVLLAPHDAELEPDCVPRLVKAAAERDRAGLACAEYGPDHVGRALPVVDRYLGGVLEPSDRADGWEACGHPHGTLMLARRACLEEVGLFDERYFAYCEEADLGVRAAAAGWEVGIVWGAVVRNPSMSSERGVPEYLMLRNNLLLIREHSGRWPAAFYFGLAVWLTVRGALGGRKTLFWHLPARRLALRDFLRRRYGPPPAELTG